MGNLITQVENPIITIEELPQHSQPSQGFKVSTPPFFGAAKIFTISKKGQSKTQSQRLRWKLPPKALHPPSLPPNELFAFPAEFSAVASDVAMFFVEPQVGWCFMSETSIVFSDVGTFFSKVGVSWVKPL